MRSLETFKPRLSNVSSVRASLLVVKENGFIKEILDFDVIIEYVTRIKRASPKNKKCMRGIKWSGNTWWV